MKLIAWLVQILQTIAGLFLLAMMLLTVADVVGGMFGYPILGAEEITCLMAPVLLAFGLPLSHKKGAQIGVDLLYQVFPPRLKRIDDVIISLVGAVFFFIVAWQCSSYALELKKVGEVTATIQFPSFYLIFSIAFAFFVLALVISSEFFIHLKGKYNG